MRIVIDTNIVVSAAIADGNPENVINFIVAKNNWEWIMSEAILDEYKDVLNRPKLKLTNTVKQKWLNMFEDSTTKIKAKVEVFFPRDRKDEKI